VNAYVTVLTRLEDTLVEEITEHEIGACELINHDCSVTPWSIISWHSEPLLACRKVTEECFSDLASLSPIVCPACGHTPWQDCWSVVILP
jgi:hypothetical protein